MIIAIDTQLATPIYEQLRDQIVLGMAANKLAPGEVLPSVRSLAADLGINFHTVSKAYAMLCEEGYIFTDRKLGTVVAKGVKGGKDFLPELSSELTLTAAVAVCHEMDREAFLALCAECYQSAKGEPKNGGIV